MKLQDKEREEKAEAAETIEGSKESNTILELNTQDISKSGHPVHDDNDDNGYVGTYQSAWEHDSDDDDDNDRTASGIGKYGNGHGTST